MAGWGLAAAGAHPVDALAPCSVLDDGLDDGAGQGGLVDPHAGLAGGALDTIDQGAPPRRAALALATLDRLRGDWPRLPVLVVSGSLDESLAGEALRRGASGFLSKSVGSDQLIETLRRTLLVDAGEASERAEPLSDRQQEVLGLLLEGKSNKLICRELDLSEATVKSHLQAIFRKLEVSSRTQAVLAAMRLGLSPDGSGGPR